MYKNCMFCTKPLGANAVVESFPVGRRLAFDAERGRLWVICRKCERWNLTPIEERWEAVEDCERIFRGTRVRVSTENIGLARHPEGLTLVRIGRPMRPEFAAWRYGDQFGRRLRRAVLYGAGAAAAGTALVVSGLGAAIPFSSLLLGVRGAQMVWDWRQLVRLRTDGGEVIRFRGRDLARARIGSGYEAEGFSVQIRKGKKATWHHGEEAKRFATAILPKINAEGGAKRTVQQAVDQIETVGHSEAYLAGVGRRAFDYGSAHLENISRMRMPAWLAWRASDLVGTIASMPKPTRLALEMALHEEQERRAMEGELWLLERAWEEAEEIAAISDRLLLPEGAEDFDFIRERGSDASPPASMRVMEP